MTDHVAYITGKIEAREGRLKEIERERERLDHEAVKVSAELGAYRDMLHNIQGTAEIIGTKQDAAPKADDTRRSPSSSAFTMSTEWIIVLRALDARGKSFDAAAVIYTGHHHNIQLTTASVRSQFTHYVKRGYLKKVTRGKYIITPKGRERFNEAALNAGESPKENGLPLGSPETGVSAPNLNLVNSGKENA